MSIHYCAALTEASQYRSIAVVILCLTQFHFMMLVHHYHQTVVFISGALLLIIVILVGSVLLGQVVYIIKIFLNCRPHSETRLAVERRAQHVITNHFNA